MTPPTFKCGKCGGEAMIEPKDEPAVCPACCEDHDYRHERGEQGHFCQHCNAERPADWGCDD